VSEESKILPRLLSPLFKAEVGVNLIQRGLVISQSYHQSRNSNKDDWGKFGFPTQNERTFGEILSVCTTTDVTSYTVFAYLSPGTIWFMLNLRNKINLI